MKTNVPAVVVCAAFDWRLGGVRYGLLFARRWMTRTTWMMKSGW